MGKNRIGFQIVDLQDKQLTSGASVTFSGGAFGSIKNSNRKPCIVTGINVGGTLRGDEVVTFKEGTNKYTGALTDGTLEVTATSVKYTEANTRTTKRR